VLAASGIGLSLLELGVGARLVLLDLAVLGTTVVFAVLHASVLLPQVTSFALGRWETWAALGALAPLLLLNAVYSGWVNDLTGGGANLFDQLRAAGLGDAALVLSFCALPAVTEEVAFRGLVQRWLEGVLAPGKAIALAAALFTVVHLSLLSVPYLFLAGCLLGWVRWRTGSLWPCVAVHFLHNLVVLTAFPG
jgi:membrane protease YdiL (CAAX protease family)